MGREWRRKGILALVCTALYWVDVPYRATFFDIPAQGSLAHLHAGWLFAVAMLYRDRASLAVCIAAAFASWATRVALIEGGGVVVYFGGALSYALTYAGLRAASRWLVPPTRQPFVFAARDLPGFALAGMLAYPAAVAAFAGLYVGPYAGPVVAANEAAQVLFAKLFGVLVVSLPVIVLGTHEARGRAAADGAPSMPWTLLLVGIGAPAVALRIAPADSPIADALLASFTDYRLLVAALLVLAAKRCSLRFSMTVLVLAEFLFVWALARNAGPKTLLDTALLMRFAIECVIALWLVLALLLFGYERDAAAQRHQRASLHDPLSDLPNLSALRRRCAGDALPPLGFILLDRSESILAGLGLRAQAELSRWIANLLRDIGRTYDVGTGHLVVVLHGDLHGDAARAAWDAVLSRLHEGEFLWLERPVRVLPYLGIAADEVAEGFDARIARASDAAMEARDRGELRPLHAGARDGREALSTHGRSLQVSTNALARIRAGEIELYCQPLVALSGHAADSGAHGEILCRLQDEFGRLLLPEEFLRELQDDRRMAELDLAVVRALDRWLRRHDDARVPISRISVNLGGQSLASLSFARELLALVDDFAVAPGVLSFEVTETAAITHASDAIALLDALRERGCCIAIDDFGIGYQSFERLKQIPANVIKIDGSFVRDLARDARDLATVRAIVTVARAYGAETVAEWVENEQTLVLLRELGVDWAQGFHLARPRPIDELLLAKNGAATTG
ncbi:EAL domain-containing protein [Dokdonella fugitiva]|uniref:EAL domain-containing protein n=1 Tax=Dokdonella fugitiva TaxID=328517 RepID=UPI0015FA8A3C|nr:bifunctional diguanylate cyclase/phosphodiesterase [Dokdonella fugitiva]MBA8885225.1 EAL domain-containing protein (putative c-di-GMP-specific phosphodiesterase class I)/GGDEF domain-containing protein [Dokdonella fugitiva]